MDDGEFAIDRPDVIVPDTADAFPAAYLEVIGIFKGRPSQRDLPFFDEVSRQISGKCTCVES